MYSVILLHIAGLVAAHSWVERIVVLGEDGVIRGEPGYPRGYVPRASLGFSDSSMSYLLPPDGRVPGAISAPDLLCKESQADHNQTLGSPLLSVAAGSDVLLMFQENGHVTLLDSEPYRVTSGTVYVYGTPKAQSLEKFSSVHDRWGMSSIAEDVLLTVSPFDDGSCYQINEGPESQRRRSMPQRKHLEFEGRDLWCAVRVSIPNTLSPNTLYTLYWVWDYSPMAHGLEKQQFYTTCIDLAIIAPQDGQGGTGD